MEQRSIAVLFSGNGTNFRYLLENLDKRYKIVVALTNNPDAKGIDIAHEFGIECIVINSKEYKEREDFDREVVSALSSYDLDLVVLAGFMRILTPIFIESFKAINLHPSLLPRHKGLRAIERSYEDEYADGGVSVHFVSSELDGGEIILQKSISKENLSFDEYNRVIRDIEKEALLEAIYRVLE